MTGYKNYNREAFMQAEKQIRHEFKTLPYLEIINPAKIADLVNESFKELNTRFSIIPNHKKLEPKWADYMRMCLAYLVSCTHLIFLEGYQMSEGAMLEGFVAKKLGIKCADSIPALKMEI
jgi:hypothetical protein